MLKIVILYETKPQQHKDLGKIDNPNVLALDYFIPLGRTGKLMKAVRKIWCSNKVNNIIRLPHKELWSSLNYIEWADDTQYLIVFYGMYNKHLDPSYLLTLREKHNIEYAIFLQDPLESPSGAVSKYYIKSIPFKYIFTFDPLDAEKYKYIFFDLPYSPSEIRGSGAIEYDIYYVGHNVPGRTDTINAMCHQMRENGVTCKLRLVGVQKNKQNFRDMIIYNQYIAYDLVLNEMNKANCILEMVRTGQHGSTLRYYEAVCYNKKLLTNNKNVVNLPFYNPDYIHVYENSEDIDWSWVREHIPVDYHYDGRFSSTHLIDKIIELEDEKGHNEHDKK